jgi:glycosyltransferase involved in cell wall biosynthesis
MTVRVSVLMAVHNGEKYLHQAMESILNQTHTDFEFIILDDGSSDSTGSILDEYVARDRRIVLVSNETNIGLTRSLNRGLELAQGEYIARMDADDISLPGRLVAQISFLDNHPEVAVLGTAAYLIDASGVQGELIQFPESHDHLRWLMCFDNHIIHPSAMFRRALAIRLRGYDESVPTSQDFNLWYRMSRLAKLSNLQKVYLYLRKHAESVSSTQYLLQQHTSMQNCALSISEYLDKEIDIDKIKSYRDYFWNGREIEPRKLEENAKMLYKLARVFLQDQQVDPIIKTSIFENVKAQLLRIHQDHAVSAIARLKIGFWIRLLSRSV